MRNVRNRNLYYHRVARERLLLVVELMVQRQAEEDGGPSIVGWHGAKGGGREAHDGDTEFML